MKTIVEEDEEKYLLVDRAFRFFYNTVRSLIKSENDLRMLGRQLRGATNALLTHYNTVEAKEVEKQKLGWTLRRQ